jgi:sorbitol-specific phosphotransferase system component IIC
MNQDTIANVKQAGDWLAGGITIAVIIGWLPTIASLLTIVYMTIRIWESATVRRLLRAVCTDCAAWWER